MRLVEEERQVVHSHARKQVERGLWRQAAIRHADLVQARLAHGFESVLAPGEPDEPGLAEQLQLLLLADSAPEVAGAPRRSRVPPCGVFVAVRHAIETRGVVRG